MSLANLLNSCWMAACWREARAFERDSKNVRRTQAVVLERILQRNRHTWFGHENGFTSIRHAREFQRAVPLTVYDDYRAAIARIADGEQQVLTADAVQLLEPTGGSTSGEKLIPFTSTLGRSFHRGIRAWIWDLYSQRPAVRRGRSYWSITPLAAGSRRTKSGIPIGFEFDTQYLSRWEQLLAQTSMIVPREVVRARSISAAQYATLFHLLRARDLSLISVWSPTFLTGLFQLLEEFWDQLVNDVAIGRISSDLSRPCQPAQPLYRPLSRRADELRWIFGHAVSACPYVLDIWPSLALVSCWADGPSSVYAESARRYLGGIEIQPKGLLATEAIVTLPRLACAAAALAIRSHFFEFQPAEPSAGANDTRPLMADELVVGQHYRVIVTTDGGLYRYQLHDEIEVVGFYHEVPLMRFVGKTDEFSDIVGEKLHAAHVQSVLQRALQEFDLRPTFSQFRALTAEVPGYTLKLAAPAVDRDPLLPVRLGQRIENGLEANPGYRYARAIGQLRPLRVEFIDQLEADAITARRTTERVTAGQRLGDIKPTTLKC